MILWNLICSLTETPSKEHINLSHESESPFYTHKKKEEIKKEKLCQNANKSYAVFRNSTLECGKIFTLHFFLSHMTQ